MRILSPISQGLVASRTDANSKTTSYVYDAFGDPYTITDPAGNVTHFTFDLRGRKTAMSDPDMGAWSYNWDVLNELTGQTDAKSQNTNLYYDLLGRPTQRVEASMTSNWTYDTVTNGVGALASACTGTGCTMPSNSNYFRAPGYDSYGRPDAIALTIGGTTYNYGVSYDSNGRLYEVTYPSGFVAKYVYTSLGYLSEIVDNGSGTVYWTANARDAELHLIEATAGNGVVTTQNFDPNTGLILGICAISGSGSCGPTTALANFDYQWDTIGRLGQRQENDPAENYTESFCYDALNRLQNYALGSTCTSSGTKTMGYDALGDITSKSDVGTYSYPTTGSAQPHAVSGITGTVNGVTNPTFTYDLNGNMTAGAGRSITWTSFNMASSVVDGSTTVGLTYDDTHARITKTGGGTTVYLNDPITGAMSEKVSGTVTTTWHDFIIAEGTIVAQRATTSGTVTNLYFTSDHLGSASVLTNASGAVTTRLSYDAWGRRRNANGTDSSTCLSVGATTRGYTDQEMMDSLCYINLNARLYDPTIARIPSPDPMVQNPFDGQSFNRYSYVNNGPLNATDPSGYDPVISCDENGSCRVVCYNNCYTPATSMSGQPCWGCSGAGLTTGPNGTPVSASMEEAGSYSISIQGPGGTGAPMIFTTPIQLLEALDSIITNDFNNTGSVPNIEFASASSDTTGGLGGGSTGQLAGDWLGFEGDTGTKDANGAEIVNAYIVPVYSISDINGGAFNNGVYYPDSGPGMFAVNGHAMTEARAVQTIFMGYRYSDYLNATYHGNPNSKSAGQQAYDLQAYNSLQIDLTSVANSPEMEDQYYTTDDGLNLGITDLANSSSRNLYDAGVNAGLVRAGSRNLDSEISGFSA